MHWLDRIPWLPLLLVAVLLGLAPYPGAPVPHLVEKIQLLMRGELSKPIDIFDLFLHGTPLVLVLLKIVRQAGFTRNHDA